MRISEFLFSLYQKGITVQLEQKNLKISVSGGALPLEIKNQLRERKEEIIAYLSDKQSNNDRITPLPIADRSNPIPASSSQRG